MHYSLYITFLRLPLIIRMLLIVLTLIMVFGGVIHLIEPTNFPTYFDGIWWAIVTASTIGYGDFVPVSILGRLVGIALILFGAGFISYYFFNMASTALSTQNKLMEGTLAFQGKDHVIVVGWNERSRKVISSLLQNNDYKIILLIDETLSENPYQNRNVYFIHGRPTVDDTLLAANALEAKKVIITADQHKDEHQADMNSILTLLTVKGICPNIKCLVEILQTDQVENAKRAGADCIIETNNIVSSMLIEKL